MLLKAILSKQQTVSKGVLYTWGSGYGGMLGTSTLLRTSTPALVNPTTATWKQIAGSYYNAGGIKSDGSLWVWGRNEVGQLGQGYQSGKFSSPILSVAGVSWTKISTSNHILGIKSDGTLWAWGNNGNGQLGIMSSVNEFNSPVLVSGPTGASWMAVAAGSINSYGITTDGKLYAWGSGNSGRNGNLNSTVNISSPILVSGPASTSWSSVAAGGEFALAITTQGRLYAWGRNLVGALGDNTTVDKSSPVLVSGPAFTSWSTIAGGFYHSLAITSQGRLYAWGGDGGVGALGNLSINNVSSPVLVSGPATTSWIAVAGGGAGSYGITSLGRLYAWGGGYNGQLGDSTLTSKSSPVLVSGPATTSWSSVTSSNSTGYAITTGGRLYAWGLNTSGQVGISTTTNVSSPVLVSGPSATSWTLVASISNTEGVSALSNNNDLYYWATNNGVFATGTSSPIQIGSSSWTAMSTGVNTYFAITTEGRLYAWGDNAWGQLGDLSTVNKSSPILVSGPANTSWSVIAAWYTAYGITNQGRLYAWGYNFSGEIGDLTTTAKSSPVLVSGPSNTSWTAVSGGKAITTQGRLYAWGTNFQGEIGDLTTVSKSSPVLVSGPSATSWISVAGTTSVLGITSLGRLYAWGDNQSGGLGDLSTVNKSSPVLVSGPAATSWTVAKSGGLTSLGITNTGRLYAWGYNLGGQLGDNTVVSKSSPILVSGPAATSWSLVASAIETMLAVTNLL